MATLGQAYVQIMPSSKGISGSIQKVINPEATAAGKSAGSKLAEGISKSMGKLGSTLTKSITLPALGAAAAAGGIVAAFGWKRLVGLDSAQAQLQGLGYDIESVERISSLVNDAIQGTVTTMAEGVSIAAGGLAAGVKEGAELEKYIQLVGDAAVGANRPVNDMAQIFNRVQGSGKLMTQELNMIEDGMPGFAMAMSKNLGVSQEEFRKMVTAGEVSSEQFLGVMDSFAGEMSGAYAKSWQGMVSNTKAWIGIIGESILGGVFEQSKESIAEFMEFLKSDDVQAWAAETGQAIGEAFSGMIESVKSAIEWWTNLDDDTKELIATIAGIAIAIGPFLMILSKLIFAVMTVGKWFGLIKVAAGIISAAIGAISTPVLIVIGVIAGLIALFVALYKHNEGFRDLVNTVWESIKETIGSVIQAVSDFVMEIFGGLVEWWNENNELIRESIQVVWDAIKSIIMGVLDVIVPIIKTAFESVKNIIVAVWNVIKAVITTAVNLVKGIIKTVMQLITGDWRGAWETIKSTVTGLLSGIRNIISNVLNAAVTIIKGILNTIKSTFSSIFNGLKNVVSNAFNAVKSAVKNGMTSAFNTVKGFLGKFKDAGGNIVGSIADGITGAIGKVMDAIGGVVSKVRDYLPFSPAKIGPLKDLDKLDFGGTISMGIDDGASEVQKAMDSMLSTPMKPSLYSPNSLNGGGNNEVLSLLKEIADGVRKGKIIMVNDRVLGEVAEPFVSEAQERKKRVREVFV